jgi:hypothetical protein
MKRIISKCIVIFLLVSIGGTVILAQEWSAEQKEALGIVEKMDESWANRDLDGYMSCLHENFIGWYNEDPLPIDKKSLRNWEEHWLSTTKILRHEFKPVSIKVTDDIAIVNFYSTAVREDENGSKFGYTKWTVVCKKEDGKWLMMGMFGGRVLED